MEVARCGTACRWCNRTGNPTMSTTAKVSFGTVPQANQPTAAPKPDAPFRIAVLADFSGRQGRGEIGSPYEITGRRLLPISRDSCADGTAQTALRPPGGRLRVRAYRRARGAAGPPCQDRRAGVGRVPDHAPSQRARQGVRVAVRRRVGLAGAASAPRGQAYGRGGAALFAAPALWREYAVHRQILI